MTSRRATQDAQNQKRFTDKVHGVAQEVMLLSSSNFSVYDLLEWDMEQLGDLSKAVVIVKKLKTRMAKLGTKIPQPEVVQEVVPEPEVVPEAVQEPVVGIHDWMKDDLAFTPEDSAAFTDYIKVTNGRWSASQANRVRRQIVKLMEFHQVIPPSTEMAAKPPGVNRITFWAQHIVVPEKKKTKKEIRQEFVEERNKRWGAARIEARISYADVAKEIDEKKILVQGLKKAGGDAPTYTHPLISALAKKGAPRMLADASKRDFICMLAWLSRNVDIPLDLFSKVGIQDAQELLLEKCTSPYKKRIMVCTEALLG